MFITSFAVSVLSAFLLRLPRQGQRRQKSALRLTCGTALHQKNSLI